MLQFTDKEMTRAVSILAITRFFSADHKKYKRDWKVEKLDTIFKLRVYLFHFFNPVMLNVHSPLFFCKIVKIEHLL